MNEVTVKENKKEERLFGVTKVEPMFGRGRRDWSVDVLRCISCFMVCAIHSTNMTFDYGLSDIGTNPWLHHEVYRMLFASPTVLFVMVSGIFFLSPERHVTASKVWKKNVIKLSFAYIFWSLLHALYRISIINPDWDITTSYFIQQWIVQPAHLWYIPMIIGLYIICPILRPITATYDTKLFKYIIGLFIGGLILWTVLNWPMMPEAAQPYVNPIIEKTPVSLICQYPFWMLFGWIAYTYRPNKGLRYILYAIGLFTVACGIYANIRTGCTPETSFFVAVTQKFSIFSFLKNVALFYFVVTVFRGHEFSKIGQKFLRKLSDSTLLIYLAHYLILMILYNNNVYYSSGISPWLGVWLYAITAYIGGGLLATVFHLFWDPIKKAFFTPKKSTN